MGEANPVARWIMGHGSSVLLVAWKLSTISVAGVILYSTRRTRTAEYGAWICVLLLTWLTIRWASYSDEIQKITPNIHVLAECDHGRWVTMSPTP